MWKYPFNQRTSIITYICSAADVWKTKLMKLRENTEQNIIDGDKQIFRKKIKKKKIIINKKSKSDLYLE